MRTAWKTIAFITLATLLGGSSVLASQDAHTLPSHAQVARDQSAEPTSEEREIADGFFGLWKQLAVQQGMAAVLNDRRAVITACIPWQRLQRLPGGLMLWIDNWWDDSKASLIQNRRSGLDRCEKWREAQSGDCSCEVIAERQSPVLKVSAAQSALLERTPKAPARSQVTKTDDPALSAERAMPIVRNIVELRRMHGMEGTPYYLGMGKTVSLEADADQPQDLPRLVVNRGHNSAVFLARWSPDGKLIASGGSDNRVLLWRSADLQLVAELRGHADIIDALAFSPDGKTLASGAQDGIVMLWDLRTGRRIDSLAAERGRVSSLAYSNDGRLFAGYGDTAVEWHRAEPPASGWAAVEISKPEAFGAAVDWRGRLSTVGADHAALFDPIRGQWRMPGKAWTDMSGTFGPRPGLMAGRSAGKLVGSAGAMPPDGGQIQISLDDGGSISRRIDAYQKGWVDGLTFAPNGVLLASVGAYGTLAEIGDREKDRVKIWPVAGGAPVTASGSSVFAFSPDSKLLVGGYGFDFGLRIWDAATGGMVRETRPAPPGFTATAVSADGARMAIARSDGEIHLWNLAGGRLERILRGHPGTIKRLRFDPSGRLLAAAGNLERYLSVWDTHSGALIWALTPKDTGSSIGIDDVAFADDGAAVMYAAKSGKNQPSVFKRRSADGALLSRLSEPIQTGPGGAHLITETSAPAAPNQSPTESEISLGFQPAAGPAFYLQKPEVPTADLQAVAYSPGGHFVGVLRQIHPKRIEEYGEVNLTVWDTETGIIQADFRATGVHSIAIANDGSIVGGQDDGRILLWQKPSRDFSDERPWKQEALARSSGSIRDVVAMPGGLIGAVGDDGLVRLWRDTASRRPITINSVSESKWLVTRPDGRFDAADPDNLEGFSWVMPDDPFRPLSPALFMRDYFEPQLLAHATACTPDTSNPQTECLDNALPPRALVSLNRVSPTVRIESVHRGVRPDEAVVAVTALAASDPSQPNDRMTTDAYDFRLFRDGQLVGRWMAAPELPSQRDNLAAWRLSTRVSGAHNFVVRLPTAKAGQKVQFQAYAFNEDRVKSDTVSAEYRMPAGVQRGKPRAYVVAIGVDRYASGGRPLNYAAKDAEATAGALSTLKGYEVVAVPLISDAGRSNGSKAKIQAVLSALAGGSIDPRLLSDVPNAGSLRKATPDDIVILSYSGHGYTDPSQNFFLVPSDARLPSASAPRADTGLISSDELAVWLEDIDAAQIAIIIDACYSAQSVEGQGFRAGPMGDPGLGQLAYDKGIRILAATQGDDVALELGALQHGLLTYALVEEGLGLDGCGPKAEHNAGGVTLEAWLRYAEQRTPTLFDDARAGLVRSCRANLAQRSTVEVRDARADPNFPIATRRAQTPVLFDFNRSPNQILIGIR